jgi:hypothetical protein
MKKLPADFKYEMYDVAFRFVTEEDAEFILKLRTDPKKSRYITQTDYDVEKQKNWIKSYKLREREGLEYYFFITCDNNPTGVIRIYDIHNGQFEIGSIVMIDDAPIHCVLATTIMAKEIAFEVLELELEKSEAYEGNKQVVKLQKSWNKTLVGSIMDSVGENLIFNLTKEAYLQVKPKKVRQLQLVMGEIKEK